MNFENILKEMQDFRDEVVEFRHYLKAEYLKYIEIHCRKTKHFIIYKDETKSSHEKCQKVFKDFLKTIDKKKYNEIKKLAHLYINNFEYNEDGELITIEQPKMKNSLVTTIYIVYDKVEFGPFEEFIDILDSIINSIENYDHYLTDLIIERVIEIHH